MLANELKAGIGFLNSIKHGHPAQSHVQDSDLV